KVEKLHAFDIPFYEKQVRWFHVAVNDVAAVRDRERFGRANDDRDTIGDAQPFERDAVREVFALEPLHRQERFALVRGSGRAEAHEARMVERGENARLA